MATIKTRPIEVVYDITLSEAEADALYTLLGVTAGGVLDSLFNILGKEGVKGDRHTTETSGGDTPVIRVEPVDTKAPGLVYPAPTGEPRIAGTLDGVADWVKGEVTE